MARRPHPTAVAVAGFVFFGLVAFLSPMGPRVDGDGGHAGVSRVAAQIATPSPTPAPRLGLRYRNAAQDAIPRAALSGRSMDARVGDLDGDGDPDIVVATEHGQNRLLLNDGDGRFTDGTQGRLPSAGHDSEDIALADLDGDGDLDLVFVSEDDRVNERYENDGSGRFTAVEGGIGADATSNAVLAADLDADGDVDLLIGNAGAANELLLNDGQGVFTPAEAGRYPDPGRRTQDLEAGDIDGDGDLDVVEGNEDGNRILVNEGGAFFRDATEDLFTPRSSGEETREADLGDVDGDGDLDLLLANVFFALQRPQQNRLLLNDGTGAFEEATLDRLPRDTWSSADGDLVDLDADGDLDIVLSNAFGGQWRVFVNDGSGHFAEDPTALPPLVGDGIDAEAADLDGDGDLDLYLCNYQGPDLLLLAEPRPAETGAPASPSPTASATPAPTATPKPAKPIPVFLPRALRP